ncbi:MAG: hypothetical protein K0S33_173 [Bacteroidetes bacterium]|nr:hypothetical protein [Bacteroidota bacterium]
MTAMNMEDQQPKRPGFITVLCIITWVGCAFAVFGGIAGYFTTKIQCENMDSFSGLYGGALGDSMNEMMDKACQNIGMTTLINVLCGFVCLVGSIFMWKLKKIGYYIYVAGEITPVIAALFLGAGGIFGAATAIVGFVIAGVWVVLYGINLKHMR